MKWFCIGSAALVGLGALAVDGSLLALGTGQPETTLTPILFAGAVAFFVGMPGFALGLMKEVSNSPVVIK